MVAGKIYHWKHGWIPVSPAAKAFVAGKGPKPTGQRFTRSLTQLEDFVDSPAFDSSRVSGRVKVAETDGVTFMTFKDRAFDTGDGAGDPYEFNPSQRREIARTVNEVKKSFPEMKPITIVGTNDPENMGTTEWDGRRITLSSDMFDPKKIAASNESWGEHGTIASPLANKDAAGFRRAVIVHELGHALEMQKGADSRTPGENMATEPVVPASVGFTPDMLPPGVPRSVLRQYAPRFMVDTLDSKSAYAGANQWEWFAEAFADGYLNGDQTSESGQRAVKLIHQLYGGQQ